MGGRVISDGEVLLFPWKANSVVLFQICTRLRSQQRGMEVEYKSSPDHQREHRAGFYLQILKPWNWRLCSCTLNLHSHASKTFFIFEKNDFNWFTIWWECCKSIQIYQNMSTAANFCILVTTVVCVMCIESGHFVSTIDKSFLKTHERCVMATSMPNEVWGSFEVRNTLITYREKLVLSLNTISRVISFPLQRFLAHPKRSKVTMNEEIDLNKIIQT